MDLISRLMDGGMISFTVAVVVGCLFAPLPPASMAVAVGLGAIGNAVRGDNRKYNRYSR